MKAYAREFAAIVSEEDEILVEEAAEAHFVK